MGNALVGRLYHALLRRDVPLLTFTTALRLTEQDGRVTGAVLSRADGTHELRCRRGVILATGGFSRSPGLRQQLMPAALSPHSPVADTATGDGIGLAQAAGGHLGDQHANPGFWSPVSLHRRRDGSQAVFPHLVLDRGKPGLIAVNPDGVRFVNEAVSYHVFTEAMLTELGRRPTQPCFLVCDHDFIV